MTHVDCIAVQIEDPSFSYLRRRALTLVTVTFDMQVLRRGHRADQDATDPCASTTKGRQGNSGDKSSTDEADNSALTVCIDHAHDWADRLQSQRTCGRGNQS